MKLLKCACVMAVVLSLSSCISRKETVYFYEQELDTSSRLVNLDQPERSQLKIKTNDQLVISVSAPEQEAALPFNLPVVGIGNVL